jgi:ribokinase
LTPHCIDELPAEVFASPGVFLASLEVPIETVGRAIERARAGGMTVVLNPAPAALLLGAKHLLSSIDVLTPNQSEAESLAGRSSARPGQVADDLQSIGSSRLVMTVGSEGCLVVDGPDRIKVPAYRVEAVDTVGAGDAFNGALAAALSEGLSLAEAAKRANAAAAIAVTKPGAQGALPTRDEIDQMVESGQIRD